MKAMSAEIITKEDLQVFRNELLNDIKSLLGKAPPQPKEWLKAAEVRKLLKISAGTLLTLRATGKLQYSKIGGTYYYRYRDIQRMLADASDSHE
ncbi:MAG: helix-turn-helix domain-containing protein [Mucilaginibacter sp.]